MQMLMEIIQKTRGVHGRLYQYLCGSAYKWSRGECDLNKMLPGCNKAGYFYVGIPPAGSDANFNRLEDFAESVMAYVYPVEANAKVADFEDEIIYRDFLYYSDYIKTSRWTFVNGLVNGEINP
jgi:hypothetical protein